MPKKNGLYNYGECDFILPKDYELIYLPNNSTIISVRIIKENNSLKEMEIKAKYFDENFNYKRNYFYQDEKIYKIITAVNDSLSESFYEDKFIIEKK